MYKGKYVTLAFPLVFASFVFLSYLNKYFGYSLLISIFIVFLYSYLTQNTLSLIKLPKEFVFHLFFLLFLVFSTFYSPYKATTIKTSLFTLAGFLPGLYFYQFGSRKLYNKTIKVLFIFSFIFSFVTVISGLFPKLYLEFIVPFLPRDLKEAAISFYHNGTISGLTNQTGINAWFSVIGFAIAFTNYSKNKNIKSLLHLLFYLIAILFTGKRAHLLFSLISIMFLYIKKYKNKLKKLLTLPIIILSVFFILYLLFPDLIMERYINRFLPQKNTDISANRFFLWAQAIILFIRKPFFGWGYGYFSVFSEELITGRLNVHNVYIQILCETGLIGFFLFILSVFGFIRTSLKKCNFNNSDFTLSFFMQNFFLLYCLTGNPLSDTFIYSVYIFFVFSFYKLNQISEMKEDLCIY